MISYNPPKHCRNSLVIMKTSFMEVNSHFDARE